MLVAVLVILSLFAFLVISAVLTGTRREMKLQQELDRPPEAWNLRISENR